MDTQPQLSPQDELKRIIALTGRTAPQPIGAPPPTPPASTSGGIVPAAPKALPTIATPNQPVPVIPPSQRDTDTNELNRLKNTGAGVEQLQHKHPILGTIARIGDVALSSMFPSIAQQIPGTELHHSQLVNREQGRVNQDLAGEQEQAKTAGVQAGTEHTQAETGAIPAHTALEEAQTNALNNKPDKDTSLQQSYADAVNDAVKRGTNPLEDQKVMQLADSITQLQKQPQATQEKLDQQYNEAIKAGDHETAQRVLKVKHDLAAAGHIENAPKITMIVPGQNGSPGTLETLRPGQQVPTGAVTPTQFGPEQQKAQQAQRTADSTINSFTRYQKSFHDLSPQLTKDDREAMKVLASHQSEIAQSFIEREAEGLMEGLSGKPLTSYVPKVMEGTMTKQQYDALSPAGKKMTADYFHAIIANFINMKQRMGTAGSRNQAMVQAEMNAIPLPYVDQQSADAMFNDTIEDIRSSSGATVPAAGAGARRVIDLTK